MGYFVLAGNGTILEDLAGATLLGQDRCNLIERRFERSVSAATRPRFSTFLNQILSGGSNETRKSIFATDKVPRRHLHLEGAAVVLTPVNAATSRSWIALSAIELRRKRPLRPNSWDRVDSLPVHLAILDEFGTILAVNARWKQYADDAWRPLRPESEL